MSQFRPKKQSAGYHLSQFVNKTSLGRFVVGLRSKIKHALPAESSASAAPADPGFEDRVIGEVARNYLDVHKMSHAVGAATGIDVVSMWHPVPTYQYDRSHHSFGRDGYA
jgi:hypothetical protein